MQGLLAYNSNALYRLDKAAFALATQGVPISWVTFYNGGTNKALRFLGLSDVVYLGFYPSNGLYFYMRGPTASSPNSCGIYGPSGSIFQATASGMGLAGGSVVGGYGLNLPNDFAKKARAYSWNLYASDAVNKKDIVKIKNPKEILKKVEGITYTDTENKPRVGITAQNLEATNLPGAVDKNEIGRVYWN